MFVRIVANGCNLTLSSQAETYLWLPCCLLELVIPLGDSDKKFLHVNSRCHGAGTWMAIKNKLSISLYAPKSCCFYELRWWLTIDADNSKSQFNAWMILHYERKLFFLIGFGKAVSLILAYRVPYWSIFMVQLNSQHSKKLLAGAPRTSLTTAALKSLLQIVLYGTKKVILS